MYCVIEMYGKDEPWWFFDDWEKMIVSTEEFSSLEEANNSFQQHEARLAANYPEKRSKGASAIAFWDEKEQDYCVACECDVQIFHGLILVDENNQLVEEKGEERG